MSQIGVDGWQEKIDQALDAIEAEETVAFHSVAVTEDGEAYLVTAGRDPGFVPDGAEPETLDEHEAALLVGELTMARSRMQRSDLDTFDEYAQLLTATDALSDADTVTREARR